MGLTPTYSFLTGARRPLLLMGDPGDRLQSAFQHVTFDNSYPAGGESLGLASVFTTVKAVHIFDKGSAMGPAAATPLAYEWHFNGRNMLYYSASTNAALVRNAAGDWSLNRTAGGAETHYFAIQVPRKRAVANKSIRLTGCRIAYEIGVADATSIDVTATKTVFAHNTAPAVTANGLGTVVDGSYDAAHDTAAERVEADTDEHVMTVTFPTPDYDDDTYSTITIELAAVLANTGTLKVREMVALYQENFTVNPFYEVRYNYSTDKLMVYDENGVEVAALTDLSGLSVGVLSFGQV